MNELPGFVSVLGFVKSIISEIIITISNDNPLILMIDIKKYCEKNFEATILIHQIWFNNIFKFGTTFTNATNWSPRPLNVSYIRFWIYINNLCIMVDSKISEKKL